MKTVGKKRISDKIEETLIAYILGVMTLITFANVIARYVLDTNILWALEATVFLFAWMVLLGASYAVKHNLHIGVDVVLQFFTKPMQKAITIVALVGCLFYSIILLIGSWQYWYPFITDRAWFEVNDIPMPQFLQFMADWLNEGEAYEKMPRFIPYTILPLSMALLLWRFIEVGYRLLTNQQDLLIASHEAEDMLDEHNANKGAAT